MKRFLLRVAFFIPYVFFLAAFAFGLMYGAKAYRIGVMTDRIVFLVLFIGGLVVARPLHALWHETGHVLFGKLAGMCFYSMTVGFLVLSVKPSGKGLYIRRRNFTDAMGQTVMLSEGMKNLRVRYAVHAAGGPVFSLVYAVALGTFFLFAPAPNIWVYAFFTGMLPYAAYAFFLNTLPGTSGERTDGDVLFGLMRGSREAVVVTGILAVQAQSIAGKRPGEIDRSMYYDLPALPEDDPNFSVVLNLRYLYHRDRGETEEALAVLARMEELTKIMPPDYAEEIATDVMFEACVRGDKERATEIYRREEKTLAMEFPTNLRLRAAYALYVREDMRAARSLIARGMNAADVFFIKGIGRFERALLEDMLRETEAREKAAEQAREEEERQKNFIFRPRTPIAEAGECPTEISDGELPE